MQRHEQGHLQRKIGVVGHPVAHSLSPVLHRAAYDVLGLPFSYEAIDIEPGGLTNFVTALDSSWLGLSVTMPHKGEARELADSIDVVAQLSGAVNTLAFSYGADGKRHVAGYNTDVEGMRAALADAGVEAAREVAIVGGGATAASGIVAAAQLGAERVNILVRDSTRASHVALLGQSLGLVVEVRNMDDIRSAPSVDLVISTLPGDALTSLDALPRVNRAALLDVAYNPWPSVRGRAWGSQTADGGIVVSGLAMLAHQALMQVRIFTTGDGATALADEASVRRAMFTAVGHEAKRPSA